ncbi:hypothetical protein JD844_014954 [Phrynosoma platyrhinos]|uniref:RAS protein activator like 1 n=1 Tax=Phrynosoma platyrhinos TaxID=52577 RepID=A0ABQ7T6S7_PHRPL|nr:hypothetical protein JD844_014954 [Phrynosoma platyrhinos]
MICCPKKPASGDSAAHVRKIPFSSHFASMASESGTSDPYCIIKVDNEVVARTATVWKNLNPFWGEEYTLHLPMGFHNLSFYVLDEDTIGRISFKGSLSEAQIQESSLEVLKVYLRDIMESIIGSMEKCPGAMRVTFKQLHKQVADRFPGPENQETKYIAISGFLFLRFFAPAILTPKLFNLRDQHADTQTSRTLLLLAKAVQSIGNLGLQLGYGKEHWMEPLHPFILASIERVKEFLDRLIDVESENGVNLLEGLVDLAPRDISGTSDPFARILWNGHILETAIIKKTRFPHWDEMLEFVLEEETAGETPLVVEVWDWDMVGKNDFLGRVEFSLDAMQQGSPKGWYRLMPFPSAEEDAGGKLGALRLRVRLSEDRILPSRYYQPLIELLVESILCPPEVKDDVTPITLLEDVCSVESRQDVATKLVKIFLGQGLVVPFLDYLNQREISRTTDPNTLFRSNSLASKSMEQFMKVVGMPYLHEVLKSIINRIFEEKKYVELDPCKIEPSRTRKSQRDTCLDKGNLRLFGRKVQMRQDCCNGRSTKELHGACASRGLRFYPEQTDDSPTLYYIRSKRLSFLSAEASERQHWTLFHPSAIIKEGYLQTRKAEGLHLVSRFTFKKRYFWLSNESLSYSKSPDWQKYQEFSIMGTAQEQSSGTEKGTGIASSVAKTRDAERAEVAQLIRSHPMIAQAVNPMADSPINAGFLVCV